ncbi:MAG: hypothetical protein M1837_006271 [Sclerophora amabilis]|nr:MAG: hypothetical protein M1837_006271 [Sclerophora amabilis]
MEADRFILLKQLESSKISMPSCSGSRNPTEYVRRGDLTTPAAIDRDYNYLVGIERHLENVDRQMDERGIEVEHPEHKPWAKKHRLQKGEINIDRAIARCGVIVDHAPKGMRRQKDNRNGWNKRHKCMMWTVEWIDHEGRSRLGLVPETTALNDAHRKLTEDDRRQSRKRKLDGTEDTKPEFASRASEDVSKPTTFSGVSDTAAETTEADVPQMHFYLQRPHTAGRSRVLIPLPPSSPLSDSLRGHVVLEFPTIYALPHPPSSLPQGFQSESQYLGYSNEQDEPKTIIPAISSTATPAKPETQEGGIRAADAAVVDNKKLLDVVLQDLGSNTMI